MRAVLPLNLPDVHQFQVRLIDERRGLQRVAGALAPHLPSRDPSQLRMHDRNEPLESRGIALAPGLKQLGNLRSWRIGHRGNRAGPIVAKPGPYIGALSSTCAVWPFSGRFPASPTTEFFGPGEARMTSGHFLRTGIAIAIGVVGTAWSVMAGP